MSWLIENWSLIVVILTMIVSAILSIKKFLLLSPEEREKQIKQFLLVQVINAESSYDMQGVGRIKLSSVYNSFISKFGIFGLLMPFDKFSALVDDSLDEMRRLLESNVNVKEMVYGYEVEKNEQ